MANFLRAASTTTHKQIQLKISIFNKERERCSSYEKHYDNGLPPARERGYWGPQGPWLDTLSTIYYIKQILPKTISYITEIAVLFFFMFYPFFGVPLEYFLVVQNRLRGPCPRGPNLGKVL